MPFGVVHDTLGAVLRDNACRFGDRTFLTFAGQAWTYRDADRLTDELASGLKARVGISKGDHVAMLMGNSPDFVWTVFALAKLGAVAVPINTAAKGELLRYFLTQAKATTLLVEDILLARALSAVEGSGAVPTLVRVIAPEAPNPVEREEYLGSAAGLPLVNFEDLFVHGATPPETEVSYKDPMFLMYTSGTTGPSKGVVAPHSQPLSIGDQLAHVYGYTASDILYTCLPLFHANALWYSLMPALRCGATLAMSRRFSASRFWQEIVDAKATQANALGAMANIAIKELHRLDRSQLRLRQMMVVPALDKETGKPFRDLGIALTSLFAQSETFAVTLLAPDAPASAMGSAGSVWEYVEVAILDEGDWPLPPGEVGEIAVRPKFPGIMMQEYYDMPRETLGTITSLWFHTGDRGYLNDEGYLYFVDRKKDAIRRRGENISAYELEMIILRHPSLREAAAVAVPSELGEDDVLVCLIANPGASVDFAELTAFCDRNMPYFMVPRYFCILDELPKTSSEKIEKYKVRQWAIENRSMLWDRDQAGIKVTR